MRSIKRKYEKNVFEKSRGAKKSEKMLVVSGHEKKGKKFETQFPSIFLTNSEKKSNYTREKSNTFFCKLPFFMDFTYVILIKLKLKIKTFIIRSPTEMSTHFFVFTSQ